MRAVLRSLFASLALCAATEEGWQLLVTDVESATGRTCYATPGLPPWVEGTFIVSGPARWNLGKYKLQGVFDGFGLINRFEIGAGRVCYTSAWMDTTYANQSRAQGYAVGMIFEDTEPSRPSCSLFHPMCALSEGGDNNWVSTIKVGDETLLLSDTSLMLRLDLDTLQQKGQKPWLDDATSSSTGRKFPNWVADGRQATAGSAHPTQIPGTSMLVDVVSELAPLPLQKSLLSIYTFDATTSEPQNRPKLASIPLDDAPYVHSYGVTPNYIVAPVTLAMSMAHTNPLNPKLMSMLGPKWQGIHLVDMKGAVTSFDTDPFTHVHIINAFENETGVTLDLGVYLEGSPFSKSSLMDIPMFLNKAERDSNPLRATPRRVHMHLAGPSKGKATYQDFSKTPGSSADFYKVNPRHSGLPYCYYYATEWWHDGQSYASMAIMKHNLCSDTVEYWSRPAMYFGEPFFIPAPDGEEDDGLLVFMALNGTAGKSTVKMVDAKTMREVEGTSFSLAGHIPFTAHGNFFPSAMPARTAVI